MFLRRVLCWQKCVCGDCESGKAGDEGKCYLVFNPRRIERSRVI